MDSTRGGRWSWGGGALVSCPVEGLEACLPNQPAVTHSDGWSLEAGRALELWARWCAWDVVHLWGCPAVVRRWLQSGERAEQDRALEAASAAAQPSIPPEAGQPLWGWNEPWHAASLSAQAAALGNAWDASAMAAAAYAKDAARCASERRRIVRRAVGCSGDPDPGSSGAPEQATLEADEAWERAWDAAWSTSRQRQSRHLSLLLHAEHQLTQVPRALRPLRSGGLAAQAVLRDLALERGLSHLALALSRQLNPPAPGR